LFGPNIDTRGRVARGLVAIPLIVVAVALWRIRWLRLSLGALAILMLFQSVRGWCLARACGIKTRV
jgi:hypothetical protein